MKLQSSTTTENKILWLTDLHLDRATLEDQSLLLGALAGIDYDSVAVSGDISSAEQLPAHLLQISRACDPRRVYFVLGNHDYYGSNIAAVDMEVEKLCRKVTNLHYLDGSKIIDLGGGLGLMGHRGWADARAGYGSQTSIESPDRLHISDFHDLETDEVFAMMRYLGAESARLIRQKLPLALTRFRHVILLTHVPPLPEDVLYNESACSDERLPHFTNLSAGLAIRGITQSFPKRNVTVLCGHSHSRSVRAALPNLTIRVGEARTGKPELQDVLVFKA